MNKAIKSLLASSCIFLACTVSVSASPIATQADNQAVLNGMKLKESYEVLKVLVQNQYAYVLTITPDRLMVEVHQAVLRSNGWQHVVVGHPILISPPEKFSGFRQEHLKYLSMRSRASGQFVVYGYTTSDKVTSFRIKTKTGFIPVESTNGRYFITLLNETDYQNIIEIQGLSEEGKVIQRQQEPESKPRQWTHNEFY